MLTPEERALLTETQDRLIDLLCSRMRPRRPKTGIACASLKQKSKTYGTN
jgi:hypothetical protein